MVKKADFRLPTHSGKMFTWMRCSDGKAMGVAEASDFIVVADRVWRDACDVGFYVKSHSTGVEKLFLFAWVVSDVEGAAVADVYEAADGSGIAVHVLND